MGAGAFGLPFEKMKNLNRNKECETLLEDVKSET